MLSPAALRLRRLIVMHQELQTARATLIEVASELAQEIATAKVEIEAEERAEQAQRAAVRLGLN